MAAPQARIPQRRGMGKDAETHPRFLAPLAAEIDRGATTVPWVTNQHGHRLYLPMVNC
jgi:hypothetical protein